MNHKFFYSKTNTILLLILIILMVFAIKIMLKDKQTYLPFLEEEKEVVEENTSKIEGRVDDLVYFTVQPGDRILEGELAFSGSVQGAYFFEGNILINLLDKDKNVLRSGYAMATTEWMTAGPVEFAGTIDTTGISGPGYIEIQNDDPSGGEGGPPKEIFIPVVFE